jgi:anti-sigma factor RsiW
MMDCDTALTALLFGRTAAEIDAHLAACPRCVADAPHVRRVTALLDTIPAPIATPELGTHVLRTAAPLLVTNAHRLPTGAWRRFAAAIAVSVLPLPLILFVGWEALSTVNRLLSAVLPERLGFYLVATHAALLALLLAITYGAVPLLAAHQLRLQHEDTHA